MIILLEAFKIEGERSTDHFHFCRIAASFNKSSQQGRFAPGPLYSGPCMITEL
jgi:hypothetical protein